MDAACIPAHSSFPQHDVSATPRDVQMQNVLRNFCKGIRIVRWKCAVDFKTASSGIADDDAVRVVAIELRGRIGKRGVLEDDDATAPAQFVAQILCALLN